MYGDSEELLGKWFAKNPEKRKDVGNSAIAATDNT